MSQMAFGLAPVGIQPQRQSRERKRSAVQMKGEWRKAVSVAAVGIGVWLGGGRELRRAVYAGDAVVAAKVKEAPTRRTRGRRETGANLTKSQSGVQKVKDAAQGARKISGFVRDEFLDRMHGSVVDTLVLLATTMIVVPTMRRLNTSPILGFLAAGVLLGPNGFNIVGNIAGSKTIAELGVVFFLFEMGLELSSEKLRKLGSDVFGLGSTQFIGTLLAIGAVAMLSGFSVQSAIVVGGGLALSSSAFVLQLLAERGEVGTRFGRAAFGILLFQDLAVVPLLVVTPLLAGGGGGAAIARAIGLSSAKAAVALTLLFTAGKTLLQPLFRFVAKAESQEAFVATILLTVLATSTLTEGLGLSDTLGPFLAGIMLAETKFSHQVEADIKPFRGLLLGLFFITVGFNIDLRLAFANAGVVSSLVVGLMALKTGMIAALGKLFGISFLSSLRTGLLLSQGGEFAFVVFGLAQRVGVLPNELAQLLLLVVALSMAATPALAQFGQTIASKIERNRGLIGSRTADADTSDAKDFVVVAGYGRVGQSICEMLDEQLIRYMAFDMSPNRVVEARNKGLPVFFGDATRPEVLKAAGIDRARALVVTLDDPAASLRAVTAIHQQYPHIDLFCRARDAKQQTLLQLAGATAIVPELLEASLLLGGAVLSSYGTPWDEVTVLIEEGRQRHVAESGVPLPYQRKATGRGEANVGNEKTEKPETTNGTVAAGSGAADASTTTEEKEEHTKEETTSAVAPVAVGNLDGLDIGGSHEDETEEAKLKGDTEDNIVPGYAETEEEEQEAEEYR